MVERRAKEHGAQTRVEKEKAKEAEFVRSVEQKIIMHVRA